MSEFLDFLKHKYAYVAIGEFKPGRFAEAQQLYEKAVSTYTKGFKGAYLLQKPGTDQGNGYNHKQWPYNISHCTFCQIKGHKSNRSGKC